MLVTSVTENQKSQIYQNEILKEKQNRIILQQNSHVQSS